MLALFGGFGGCATAQAMPPQFDPKRHMPVADVKAGMKGYGLSVFSGVDPEPFPIEVMSVESGFEPGKSVVWIRCTDDRMQLTGPVQGMSGSPIFLWSDGDFKDAGGKAIQPAMGKGGRMIGAFAFGFGLGKDCYVGVQPIEQMLEGAARAKAPVPGKPGGAAIDAPGRTIRACLAAAKAMGMEDEETWRIQAMAGLLGLDPVRIAQQPVETGAGWRSIHTMQIPVRITGAPERMMQPLLGQFGLRALAADIPAAASLPPGWLRDKADAVKLVPGGVLSIPMVSGPSDMSAIGTVTEVLPDGTVLAFGHAFNGQGALNVPMATGFVHFVQPNIQASFKVGGTLKVVGAIVNDEKTGITGKPGIPYPTARSLVRVRWPDATKNREYDYKIAHLPAMVPTLVGSTIISSMTSETNLPQQVTMSATSTIRFKSGRKLEYADTLPGGRTNSVMMTLASTIGTILENEFGVDELESVETTLEIREGVEMALITGGTVKQQAVMPGETVTVTVELLPYGKTPYTKEIKIELPKDMPEGVYAINIGGARSYNQSRLAIRPHLARATNAKEIEQALSEILKIKPRMLYATMRLRPSGAGTNLAIGRTELPDLPSSRAALLSVPTSTRTSGFGNSLEAQVELDQVLQGGLTLPVRVGAGGSVGTPGGLGVGGD